VHAILLPDPALFELISYSLAAKVLTLEIRTKSRWSKCPECYQLSSRIQIHSSYVRTVRDLPMASFAVVLHVCVQRFFLYEFELARFCVDTTLETVNLLHRLIFGNQTQWLDFDLNHNGELDLEKITHNELSFWKN
jgi:hypothetical protein